jgi:hypothetical protein
MAREGKTTCFTRNHPRQNILESPYFTLYRRDTRELMRRIRSACRAASLGTCTPGEIDVFNLVSSYKETGFPNILVV